MIQLIHYPKCTTCQKGKKYLEANQLEFTQRDIKLEKLDVTELTNLYKKSGLPLKKFFNTSGLVYKDLKLKDKLPDMTEEEQLQLLASDGMLVKRPILEGDNFVTVGFKESVWQELLEI